MEPSDRLKLCLLLVEDIKMRYPVGILNLSHPIYSLIYLRLQNKFRQTQKVAILDREPLSYLDQLLVYLRIAEVQFLGLAKVRVAALTSQQSAGFLQYEFGRG